MGPDPSSPHGLTANNAFKPPQGIPHGLGTVTKNFHHFMFMEGVGE